MIQRMNSAERRQFVLDIVREVDNYDMEFEEAVSAIVERWELDLRAEPRNRITVTGATGVQIGDGGSQTNVFTS